MCPRRLPTFICIKSACGVYSFIMALTTISMAVRLYAPISTLKKFPPFTEFLFRPSLRGSVAGERPWRKFEI